MLIALAGFIIGVFFLGSGIYSASIQDFSPKLLFGGLALIALSLVAIL
jgi:hypothetical protein